MTSGFTMDFETAEESKVMVMKLRGRLRGFEI